MAIEDAAILARCVAGETSVARALQRYQRTRMARTARIVNESTATRSLYRIEDENEMRRAFQQKNPSQDRSKWLYSYDPLTESLQEP
jgi:salicylate hydroxylase